MGGLALQYAFHFWEEWPNVTIYWHADAFMVLVEWWFGKIRPSHGKERGPRERKRVRVTITWSTALYVWPCELLEGESVKSRGSGECRHDRDVELALASESVKNCFRWKSMIYDDIHYFCQAMRGKHTLHQCHISFLNLTSSKGTRYTAGDTL